MFLKVPGISTSARQAQIIFSVFSILCSVGVSLEEGEVYNCGLLLLHFVSFKLKEWKSEEKLPSYVRSFRVGRHSPSCTLGESIGQRKVRTQFVILSHFTAQYMIGRQLVATSIQMWVHLMKEGKTCKFLLWLAVSPWELVRASVSKILTSAPTRSDLVSISGLN